MHRSPAGQTGQQPRAAPGEPTAALERGWATWDRRVWVGRRAAPRVYRHDAVEAKNATRHAAGDRKKRPMLQFAAEATLRTPCGRPQARPCPPTPRMPPTTMQGVLGPSMTHSTSKLGTIPLTPCLLVTLPFILSVAAVGGLRPRGADVQRRQWLPGGHPARVQVQPAERRRLQQPRAVRHAGRHQGARGTRGTPRLSHIRRSGAALARGGLIVRLVASTAPGSHCKQQATP